MLFAQLFWSFFQIGLFSIGGGYAAMPLIQQQVVDQHGWLTMAQFADIMTIAEMTPGPIAINSATFVGIRVAGLPGAIVATAGCVLPSCAIVLALAFIYYHFYKLTAVVAMIASAGLSLLLLALFGGREMSVGPLGLDVVAAVIFAAGFLVLRRKRVNPIWIMMASGAAGVALYSIV